VDELVLTCRGGCGGDGSSSFQCHHRELKGKPDGGDGGRGGHVYIVAPSEEENKRFSFQTLDHLSGTTVVAGGHGGSGAKRQMSGKQGLDKEIKVPVGTVVTILERTEPLPPRPLTPTTNFSSSNIPEVDMNQEDLLDYLKMAKEVALDEPEFDRILQKRGPRAIKRVIKERMAQYGAQHVKKPILIHEMKAGDRLLVATGGKSGRGNDHMGLNNDICEKGSMGVESVCHLTLKLFADIGLVGFPNAGKSSFLAAMTQATPKIANYPFTTLNPSLGAILDGIEDFNSQLSPAITSDKDHSMLMMADIPGLVEGAHKNFGLGHQFLKHIEKSKVLCFVLDMSLPDSFSDFCILQSELSQFHATLFSKKPACIIANKMDRLPQADLNLQQFKSKLASSPWSHLAIYPISAKFQTGLTHLPTHLRLLVFQAAQ
jgi:GTPase